MSALCLIGYFEVTWHLTIKLIPAKISERATLQNLWRQRVTLHCYPPCLPTTALRGLMNFQLQIFQLYNKSLKDWSVERQLILFPENINVTRGTLRFSRNRINCLPTDQSLSVYYWPTCGHVFFNLNITQQARCSPGIKKSYMKKCLLTRYWSALDKNSRQWSYKPIPPIAYAASHKIIMSELTMRISTLTPWKVVRNFCGSISVPSVEGEWKLSKSPRTICSNLSLSHMSTVLAVFHIEVSQPGFFSFDAL